MSAIRLPLLCAFAGGCLSSAVLLGVWHVGLSATAAKQQHPPDVALVTAIVNAAIAARSAEEQQGALASAAPQHAQTDAPAAAPQATQELDSVGPAPAGSAVSDVLTSLEAAYRARVAATAPARAPSTEERAVATAPLDDAVTSPNMPPPNMPPPEAPPAAVAQPIAEVAPLGAAPAVAPSPAVPAAAPPPIAAAPAYVDQGGPPPSEIQIGDVNQNTYNITNVREGDVYLVQMQQIAMLQYMQLLGMSPGVAAPARRGRGAGHQSTPFPSSIPNPDNPWGFHMAPLHLVH